MSMWTSTDFLQAPIFFIPPVTVATSAGQIKDISDDSTRDKGIASALAIPVGSPAIVTPAPVSMKNDD